MGGRGFDRYVAAWRGGLVSTEPRRGRADRVGAKALAEALGRLPLALEQAGAFCKTAGLSFDDYRARMTELIRLKPRGARYPNSVFASMRACAPHANRPSSRDGDPHAGNLDLAAAGAHALRARGREPVVD
jgi:hypothetical protein